MLLKRRWGLKALMVVVAIFALTLWAGLNWSPWPKSLRDWRIRRHLDHSISLHFPNGIPLHQFLDEIRQKTKSLDSPGGLTICYDPEGVENAGRDLDTIVKIDVESIPLREALKTALEPLV